jgi:hypothetical protein
MIMYDDNDMQYRSIIRGGSARVLLVVYMYVASSYYIVIVATSY